MKLPSTIGAIEFEDDEVRIAIVRTGARVPSITEAHACRAAYASASERFEALVAAVKHARSRMKAKPAAWVLCARTDYAIARKLTLPFKGKSKVASAVPFELEPYLAFPIDDLAVDYSTIREADGSTDVLAVGVRRTLLEEQIEILSAAGIEVEGIGLDGTGLTSLLRAREKGGNGLSAVLHVRETGSSIVVTLGTALVFLRHLPLTAAAFRGEPESVAREVQNTLRAFQASWPEEGVSIPELIVTGQAMAEDHRADFEQGLDTPVRYVDLMDGLKGADRVQGNGHPVPVGPQGPLPESEEEPEPEASPGRVNAWAALVGVSLTAAGGPYGLEFRTGPLAAPGAWSGLARHAVFSAALALLLLVGYGMYSYVNYQRNQEEIARIGNAIWEYYAEAFPESPEAKEGRPPADIGGNITIELMRRDTEAAQQNTDLSDIEIYQRPPLPEILKEISLRMPDDRVRVTSIPIMSTLRRGDMQSIIIEGEVTNPGAFDDVMAGFKESELFKRVEDAQRRDDAGQATFSVRAYI